jgi:hypothetical protein
VPERCLRRFSFGHWPGREVMREGIYLGRININGRDGVYTLTDTIDRLNFLGNALRLNSDSGFEKNELRGAGEILLDMANNIEEFCRQYEEQSPLPELENGEEA